MPFFHETQSSIMDTLLIFNFLDDGTKKMVLVKSPL